MDVSAVITNYNTWHLAGRCVEELRRLSGPRLKEVIVVDDGSDEQGPELAAPATVIRNLHNKGYAASVNVGVSVATSDVVVLLDSDARPLSDVVSPCVEAFSREPRLGALGFRTLDEEGKETGSSEPEPDALGLLLGQRLNGLRGKVWPGARRGQRLFYSCAIAIRRAAFDSVQGFDEAFDFLDADLDFSKKLHQAGWGQRLDPRLVAVHVGGGSPQATAKRVLRFHRNRWRFLDKHGRLPLRVPLKLALAARHAAEYLALRTAGVLFFRRDELSDKLAGRRALLRGVWSGYGNH